MSTESPTGPRDGAAPPATTVELHRAAQQPAPAQPSTTPDVAALEREIAYRDACDAHRFEGATRSLYLDMLRAQGLSGDIRPGADALAARFAEAGLGRPAPAAHYGAGRPAATPSPAPGARSDAGAPSTSGSHVNYSNATLADLDPAALKAMTPEQRRRDVWPAQSTAQKNPFRRSKGE
jgi:hypothetical protein